MARFGDFTLLEDLGRSAAADRFKAIHDAQGGPFFLKVYSRLEPRSFPDLAARCERLMGIQHANLAPHLGHGVQDGVPFVVSPYLEGIDLAQFASSLKDRRVTFGLDGILLVLRDLARAVAALHATALGGTDTLMAHGAVHTAHVRVGPDGQVWLTGLTTPRGAAPGRPPAGAWDLAGVGALVYDLLPLVRTGARATLPPALDGLVRRALGLGPPDAMLSADELSGRLGDAAERLKLKADRKVFAELVQRTARAVERKLKEQGGRPAPIAPTPRQPDLVRTRVAAPRAGRDGAPQSPADAIPVLDPVDVLPTLEPIGGDARAAVPAPILELVPLDGPASEPEATTRLLEQRPAPAVPARPPKTPSAPKPAYRPADRPSDRPRDVSGPSLRPPGLAQTVAPAQRPGELPAFMAPPSTGPGVARAAPPGALPPDIRDEATNPAVRLGNLPTDLPTDAVKGDVTQEAVAAPPPSVPDAAPRRHERTDPRRKAMRRPLLADPDEGPPTDPRGRAPGASVGPDDATDPSGAPTRSAAARARAQRAVDALVKRGLVQEQDVERAAGIHAHRGGRLVEVLVAEGVVTDAAVADALADEAAKPRLSDAFLMKSLPPPALCRRLPQTYALGRRVLPLTLDAETHRLSLAVSDPFEEAVIDEVKQLLGATSVQVQVAARAALTAATIEAYKATGIGALTGANASSSTVLLAVDDDGRAQKVGSRLAQEGYRVELVADVATAKDILASRPPDAVLCAHVLGGAPIDPLLVLARDDERTHDMPFFVLGPKGDDAFAERMVDLGADDSFGEPLRLDVVMAKLRRALQKAGKKTASSPSMPAVSIPALDEPSRTDPMPAAPSNNKPPATSAPPAPPLLAAASLASLELPGLADLPDLPPPGDDPLGAQPDVPAMPTGVMGTLKQMSVSEIVQSLEMGRKTARVELVPANGTKGTMAFDGGQICYAVCGEKRGDDAFYELARHTEGFFRIHYGQQPPEKNIDAPTTFLLLEAMRRMDEEGQPPAA